MRMLESNQIIGTFILRLSFLGRGKQGDGIQYIILVKESSRTVS
jgi:hypothetical protein